MQAPPPQSTLNGAAEPTTEMVSIPTTVVRSSQHGPVQGARLSLEAVQISLDDDEHHLFQTLVDTATAYEQGTLQLETTADGSTTAAATTTSSSSAPHPPGSLQIRVAGGWVRDKLLGLETHDVDCAINVLTGVQFAQLVQTYMQRMGQATRKIGVIAANPSQSKHLETATCVIDGIDVDFCNLRADEVYVEDSRIPECVFGTAAQDADRRDFTCNALFYNIRSGKVEDWTGRGLRDLMAGELVTPLEPVRTFRDDPLRVLRAIRFAVRYQFRLDPALEAAAVLTEIHDALHLKVSRERVGKELEAMLSGKGANPLSALNTIARLKLAGGVFCIPKAGVDKVKTVRGLVAGRVYEGDHDANAAVRAHGWEESKVLLNLLPEVAGVHATARTAMSAVAVTSMDQRLLPVAIFLLPFRALVYEEVKKVDKVFLAVSFIFREGIKFKNKDCAAMTTLMETVDPMVAFLTKCGVYSTNAGQPQVSRLDAGLLLRKTKDLWVSSLLMATVLKVRQQQQGNDGVTGRRIDWVQLSTAVYGAILTLGLEECWKLRPLLDGKAVIQMLELPRGPAVGTYLDEQMRWMLQYPAGSREECQQHLLSVKRQLQGQQGQECLGMSDGTGTQPSSPVQPGKNEHQHFSKKLHVESMELER